MYVFITWTKVPHWLVGLYGVRLVVGPYEPMGSMGCSKFSNLASMGSDGREDLSQLNTNSVASSGARVSLLIF